MAINRISNGTLTMKEQEVYAGLSKGIYNALKKTMEQEIKSLVESCFQSLREEIDQTTNQVKAEVTLVRDWCERNLTELRRSWERSTENVRTLVKSMPMGNAGSTDGTADLIVTLPRVLGERFDKQLAGAEEGVDRRIKSLEQDLDRGLQNAVKQFEVKVESLEHSFISAIDVIKTLLTNLQVPPPEIVVNVPGQVVKNEVNVPPLNVVLPDMRPQITNEIKVLAPPQKPMKKSITYDEDGRPAEIIEREA